MSHKADRRTTTTKTVRETEAEAIAFVVSRAAGLDTGTASAAYIQLYHGNASLLAESLEVILKVSAVILAALKPKPEFENQETQEMKWQSPASLSRPCGRMASGYPLSLSVHVRRKEKRIMSTSIAARHLFPNFVLVFLGFEFLNSHSLNHSLRGFRAPSEEFYLVVIYEPLNSAIQCRAECPLL